MAIQYTLAKVANQTFTVNVGAVRYDIELKNIGQFMEATIKRNSIPVVSGFRVVTGQVLMPYSNFGGNFIFISDNDDIVTFNQFGVSQFFRWLDDEELAAL